MCHSGLSRINSDPGCALAPNRRIAYQDDVAEGELFIVNSKQFGVSNVLNQRNFPHFFHISDGRQPVFVGFQNLRQPLVRTGVNHKIIWVSAKIQPPTKGLSAGLFLNIMLSRINEVNFFPMRQIWYKALLGCDTAIFRNQCNERSRVCHPRFFFPIVSFRQFVQSKMKVKLAITGNNQ